MEVFYGKVSMVEFVLITGATTELGMSYAMLFASDGNNLF
jgi:short-subunit dehydrogenase